MKSFMEILLERDCFCKTDGSERLYSYSDIESAFDEYKESVPAETVVIPKIAEGFKIKYRSKVYDDVEIRSNGNVTIHLPSGSTIQTSLSKCELQISSNFSV